MMNIGGLELLVILLVALVFLGPERLPEVARQVGQTVNTLRGLARSFQTELESAARPDSLTGPGTKTPVVVDEDGISSDPFDLAAKARAKSAALKEADGSSDDITDVNKGGPSDLTATSADDADDADSDQDPVPADRDEEEE